jgi:hypothetical protein
MQVLCCWQGTPRILKYISLLSEGAHCTARFGCMLLLHVAIYADTSNDDCMVFLALPGALHNVSNSALDVQHMPCDIML